MRFRLRTLLIVLALGPPVLAAIWWHWELAIAFVGLTFILEPALFIDATFGIFYYSFGALCYLAGGWPRNNRCNPK